LSNRWGLKQPHRVLDAIAAMPVDVVCTGHDHEERVELVGGRVLVSAANTLSSRMRGKRPSALNVIEMTSEHVTVQAWGFDGQAFVPGPMRLTASRSRPGAASPR
jgi:predicted phosphodiesterase